jgi:hypothetical protein
MNDEQVGRQIDDIERALRAEDPAFVHRVRNVQRKDAVNVLVVSVLLAVGAVLLTAGLATRALIPWLAGLVALIAAVLTDDHHKRTLR